MQFMANILFSEKRYSIIKLIRIVIVLMKCWQIKEKIILIILSILFVIFMACLIIWRMKKYYVDERLTGDVLWILKKSPEIVIRSTIVHMISVAICCGPVFMGRIKGYPSFTLSGLAAALICMAVLTMQPYKICQKGIITDQGFIRWEMIRKIMEAPKDDRVRLKLKRQTDNEISIYCQGDDREWMEKYIWERIGEE